MKLVLATHNLGKVRELTKMLDEFALRESGMLPRKAGKHTKGKGVGTLRCAVKPRYEVVSLEAFPDAPEVVEDGKTYAENACKKASVIAALTGLMTLADDTGLEVDALGGAPGIASKRWVGEKQDDDIRIAKLLAKLEGVTDRTARFVAAIALKHPSATPQVVVGVCEGRIAQTAAGEGGFGYDAVFVPDGYEQTFAELGEEVKNRISHRAKALQLALKLL